MSSRVKPAKTQFWLLDLQIQSLSVRAPSGVTAWPLVTVLNWTPLWEEPQIPAFVGKMGNGRVTDASGVPMLTYHTKPLAASCER